jgi:hypothetical protein
MGVSDTGQRPFSKCSLSTAMASLLAAADHLGPSPPRVALGQDLPALDDPGAVLVVRRVLDRQGDAHLAAVRACNDRGAQPPGVDEGLVPLGRLASLEPPGARAAVLEAVALDGRPRLAVGVTALAEFVGDLLDEGDADALGEDRDEVRRLGHLGAELLEFTEVANDEAHQRRLPWNGPAAVGFSV